MSWCKCPIVGMPWCECPLDAYYDANVLLGVFHDANVPLVHAMMRMPLWWCNECKCPLGYAMNANVSLRVCHDANVRLGVCYGVDAPLWVCNDANVSSRVYHDIECFGANTIYSKIPFIFKTRLPQRLKSKYFPKLDLLFMKSHLSFDLRLPKNWWLLLENLRMGHLLEIWWSGSKDLFSQSSGAKRGGTLSRPFLERWILWKSSILKRFIFVVPEYGNLTSVKTHRDRFGNSKEGILEKRVQILVSERMKDLIEASDAIRSLPFHSSVCSTHESSKFFSFLL